MAKKIFDILPPAPFKEEKRLPLVKKVKTPESFEKKKGRKVWLGVIPLILILAVGFCFKISKVEIKIWPETDTVTFKTKLTVDKTIENPDFKNKIIPGEIFEAEKTVSEEFLASGRVLKKAEGIIRLYNAFTTESETWKEGTRFVSSDGKLFLSKDKIPVPGAEIKNGKIVPSYIDVPVIAAEPGPDYNISPSHFSIVAFRGTPRYTKFYGESFQPMTGGGQVPQVKKEDLENAEKILTERIKAESEENLKSKIPAEFVFLKDVLETTILEKFSLAKEGVEMEKFYFQVKAKSTTLSFKSKDLDNFAKEFILSQISEDKSIFQESLKIDYFPETINFALGKLSLSLNFSDQIYPEIDLISLKKGLVGKSLAETKIFLENQPKIIRAEIRPFPFPLKSIPNDIDKIEIKYPIID